MRASLNVITENELTADVLYDKMQKMLDDKKALARMSAALEPLAKTDALEKIYELMLKMSEKTNKKR